MNHPAGGGEHVLRFPPTLAGMERGGAGLRDLLSAHEIAAQARYNLELAFDEVVANIIRHAGATDDVHVHLRFASDEIAIRFEDNGVPFNPTGHPDAERPSSLDDAQVGRLGLMLVRQTAARVAYERSAFDRNILTIVVAR